MCGIFCCVQKTPFGTNGAKVVADTKHLLRCRGPDIQSEHRIECDEFVATFSGFVLWQQGESASKQPMVSGDHVLLFNGDIYSTGSLTPKRPTQSDTEWLFGEIVGCSNEIDFLDIMKRIQGPYSLIYFNHKTKRLYFARDSLGRQTMLIGSDQTSVYITSVASKNFGSDVFIEVPPIGVFCWNLRSADYDIKLNAWQNLLSHEHITEQLNALEKLFSTRIFVEESLDPFWMATNEHRSIGYDFTSLLSEHIDESPPAIFSLLSENEELSSVCDELIRLLTESVKDRVETTPPFCRNCIKSDDPSILCNHPKIAILFSGGIDCTILAILADKFVDKTIAIDLINVSFEKIVRNPGASKQQQQNHDTPDRLTSRQTLTELRQLSPYRKWNLIEVNVTREELKDALAEKISDLCYPLNSVLDESLGAALWFAASAKGTLNSMAYDSPCRVILIGSGADELFGGYTRHRNAFLRSGQSWTLLDDELHLDWTRLPSRNLARDDRVIGDHGVTARSPFVEENVAFFVRNLRASQKCFHLLPEGIGDKLLLRLCGFRLGLRNVCWLKKRALQFGSRIADRKQNAKDVSDALR